MQCSPMTGGTWDLSTGVVLISGGLSLNEEDHLTRGKHARKKNHLKLNDRNLSRLCAAAVSATLLSGVITPAAHADVMNDGTSSIGNTNGYVVSTKSFPKATERRADLFTEAVSVDVDGEWSLGENEDAATIGENLKKQADDYDRQKAEEAKVKAKAKEEQARKEAEARKAKEKAEAKAKADVMRHQAEISSQHTNDAGSDSHAASRSTAREALTNLPDQKSSSKGQAIVDGALSLVGGHMDCTMLVTLALQKGTGVYFHGWPEDYRNFPGAVETSWADAQPGDILVYRDGSSYDMNGPGHADHVAIYVGNGMAVHGGWNGGSVALAQAVTSQGIPEHIYRAM